ncbi:MAG: hypothetical protein JXB49_24450 [Bacteroidales bacterium]|nr:hypothetical protein [Bacteroidales bacterium]
MNRKLSPLKYIELMQDEIIHNTENDNPGCDGDFIVTKLKDAIKELSPIRHRRGRSKDLIKEKIKEFDRESVICGQIFATWLLKAADCDDSYCYAFNYLTQKCNRETGFQINIKNVDEKRILELIEQEHMSEDHSLLDDDNKDQKKIPAKYYALYHWILIEMGIENNFERNNDDKYSRKAIEAFATERYPNTNGQGFYRAFIGIDMTNKPLIAQSFGKGYKKVIIEISGNNAKVINHLKKFPN